MPWATLTARGCVDGRFLVGIMNLGNCRFDKDVFRCVHASLYEGLSVSRPWSVARGPLRVFLNCGN